MNDRFVRPSPMIPVVLVAVAAGFGLYACSAQKKADTAGEATPTSMESEAEESPGPDDDSRTAERAHTGVEDLVATNNQFAFDLFKQTGTGNMFVSPHGIATALAILEGGAANETRAQVRATLRADLEEADLHEKFRLLHEELRRRERTKSNDQPRGFRLRVTNGVWTDEQFVLAPDFVRIASASHGAQLQAFDFRNQPDAAREAINQYVADSTSGKITELLARSTVTNLTRLVVTNTVHFDAPWEVPFVRASTVADDFFAPSGARKVSLMSQVDRFGYYAGRGMQTVVLPYAGGEVEAVFILPEEGTSASDYAQGLDAHFFGWLTGAVRQREVHVQIPRFEIKSEVDLVTTLQGLGMTDAFDPAKADFSALAANVDEDARLYVNRAVHETVVTMDEDGTEAAAATAMSGALGSAQSDPPASFRADRPFIVAIRDVPTGEILFLGRVSDPPQD